MDTNPTHHVHRLTEEEGELLEHDKDSVTANQDVLLSEEQSYRETRALGGTSDRVTPDFDSASSSTDKNPFAAPKPQFTGKISVNLHTDDWQCKKFDRLNLTLVEGYPSKSSDASGLQHDQFIKTARSQNKWYDQMCFQIKKL